MIIITDLKQLNNYLFTDKTGAADHLGVNVKTIDRTIKAGGFINHYYITDQDPIKSKRGRK